MSLHEGDTIRLDIQFKSGDGSQLRFLHNGVAIEEEGNERVAVAIQNDVATLTIAHAHAKDAGLYECVMDDARCQVKVNIEKKKQES